MTFGFKMMMNSGLFFRIQFVIQVAIVFGLLSSCFSVKELREFNAYEVYYTTIENQTQTVYLVGVPQYGTEAWFRNLSILLNQFAQKQYTMTSAKIPEVGSNDTLTAKLRSIKQSVGWRAKLITEYEKLPGMNNLEILTGNDSTFFFPDRVKYGVPSTEIIEFYEDDWGIITVTTNPETGELTGEKLPHRKTQNIINQLIYPNIAKDIFTSGEKNVVVLFQQEFKKDLMKAFKLQYKEKAFFTEQNTGNDSLYEHMLSADSIHVYNIQSAIKNESIERMDDYLSVKMFANNKVYGLEVKTDDVHYNLFANTNTMLGVNVNYRFISFGYATPINTLTGVTDDNQKGRTKLNNYHFGLGFNHWFSRFSYTTINGFYMKNTADFDPTWQSGDPYIQFPDLHYNRFDGVVGYSFNNRFSTKALATQTERQIKSAGSMVAGIAFSVYEINDKTPLEGDKATEKSMNFEITPLVGYQYTYVLQRSWFISAGLTAGYGYQNTKITLRSANETLISHQNNTIASITGDASAGYNGRRLFAGISGNISFRHYRQEHTTAQINHNNNELNLYVGYRFEAPEIVRKFIP